MKLPLVILTLYLLIADSYFLIDLPTSPFDALVTYFKCPSSLMVSWIPVQIFLCPTANHSPSFVTCPLPFHTPCTVYIGRGIYIE